VGRGGRRPGAGRKPNHVKRLVIRAGDLAKLSPEEIQFLAAIARKLALPASDGPHNQKESNTAIEEASGYWWFEPPRKVLAKQSPRVIIRASPLNGISSR
jgi:hypothetical protein